VPMAGKAGEPRIPLALQRSRLKAERKTLDFEFEVVSVQFNRLGRYALRLTVENPLLQGSGSGIQLRVNNEEATQSSTGTTDTVEQSYLNQIYCFQRRKFTFTLPRGFCKNDKNHDVRLHIEALHFPGRAQRTGRSRRVGEAFFAIYPRTNQPRMKLSAGRDEDWYRYSAVMALLRVGSEQPAMHCGRLAFTASLHEHRSPTTLVSPSPLSPGAHEGDRQAAGTGPASPALGIPVPSRSLRTPESAYHSLPTEGHAFSPENYRMVWVGRDLKNHPVPIPCHSSGRSKPYPTWPSTSPGAHYSSVQPGQGSRHSHSKIFLLKISYKFLLFHELRTVPLILSLHSLIKSPSPSVLEPLSVLEAASSSPWSLLVYNNPNSLSLSLDGRCSSPNIQPNISSKSPLPQLKTASSHPIPDLIDKEPLPSFLVGKMPFVLEGQYPAPIASRLGMPIHAAWCPSPTGGSRGQRKKSADTTLQDPAEPPKPSQVPLNSPTTLSSLSEPSPPLLSPLQILPSPQAPLSSPEHPLNPMNPPRPTKPLKPLQDPTKSPQILPSPPKPYKPPHDPRGAPTETPKCHKTPQNPIEPRNPGWQQDKSSSALVWQEVGNYRLALKRMAGDLLSLRRHVTSLEVENGHLRRSLGSQEELGHTLLADDMAWSLAATLKRKLVTNTLEMRRLKDRVQQLQNELIRKNDREKDLVLLQRAHQQQQATLKRCREKEAKINGLEETVRQQEKVIKMMEQVLQEKLVGAGRSSEKVAGGCKDREAHVGHVPVAPPPHSTGEVLSREVYAVLLAENRRLREELARPPPPLSPVILQPPALPGVFRGAEKLSLLARLEEAEARGRVLERQLKEAARRWGREKQELGTRLLEQEHGF
ncbi:CCD33 protein, partial [Centropus unirufus]|nr:CCD33 protein [Centropus unirufus]